MPPLVDGYDELRLRIDSYATGKYQVLASNRLAEATDGFELPFEQLELENFILRLSHPRGRRRIDHSAIDEARRFGGELFKALFHGEIHSLYRDALADARGRDRGVRITLCLSGSPELIDVPWEYLFDDPDFLAMSALTPVVRYLDLPRAHRPLLVKPPLRLLGVVSSPADYEQLDVARERANLQNALATLTESGAVELQWLERPTLGALLHALQTQTFHALHYVGHGTYDRETDRGALLFEDDGGWARPVTGDRLGMILHDFTSLRLAILNACEGARTARTDPFAGVAGSLVRRDIPAVVAMQFEISDEAAIVFASGFYEQLAGGAPVDASLAAARLAMLAQRGDEIEWGTPVLFMRVPDGRIFDLGDARNPSLTAGSGLRILINYRREDTSGHALLLADRLRHRFGSDSVELALDGAESDRLAGVKDNVAFLALVGPGWTEHLRTAASSRHTEDFVRREIELALRDIPEAVVPVLIDASMPAAETLPRSLRGLCRQEPAELRHLSFDRDLSALISRLEAIAERPRPASPPDGGPVQVVAPTAAARTTAGVSTPYDTHYADVVTGMLDGAVVPLLGPGVTGAMAAADHLSQQFATASAGLAEVAQRVAVTLGERRLYTALKSLVAAHSEPGDVHRVLAEFPGLLRRLGLPPRHQLIVSANYDAALERAFDDANEPFDYAVYMAGSGWFVHVPWGERESEPVATTILEPKKYVGFPIDDDGELERTIIVKIHGGMDGHEGGVTWRNNYVVTEDHYIDYLPTHNIQDHLPIQILDKLTGSRCLFLGYALRNWDARVFLRRIWRGKPISENSWAIEADPDPIEKASWSVVGHVELLAASMPEYATALRATLLHQSGRREDLRAPR
jgi:CHAT domain-containing protein/SIR2-like protein